MSNVLEKQLNEYVTVEIDDCGDLTFIYDDTDEVFEISGFKARELFELLQDFFDE